MSSNYSKKKLLRCQPYSFQFQINCSNYLQMCPNKFTLEFSTRRKEGRKVKCRWSSTNSNAILFRHFQQNVITLEHYTKSMLCSLQIGSKFAFFLTSTDCTLYCDLKLLTLIFTTGMSSHVLDCWALELQQFNIKFEHIQGKKNTVTDTFSRLRTIRLYQDNYTKEAQPLLEDAAENFLEEVHNIHSIPTAANYNKIDKLYLDILQREQWGDNLCKKKVKEIKTKPDPDFTLDENNILKKAAKLRYSAVCTIIVPKKLTHLVILEVQQWKRPSGNQLHYWYDVQMLLVNLHVERPSSIYKYL